ncbi:MAG: hypothetical protein DIZ80_03810 [endosymbiont of Galathealinum brachiosum]|uniref:Rhodanese domain-containing protein n=1 Tax=endosymbiont of Galathealinum brachiosum TaxID=2200906 RepID=A0A370DJQ2_9GAMM|nr:MAG: hypothetical protein DIZ80_03810 [endosymbiont of Galathealinum brachiosum]
MILRILLIFSLQVYSVARANPATSDTLQHEAPEAIKGVTTLSANQIINEITDNNTIVLIDSRYPADRKQGFIQGSIPLPDTSTNCTSLKQNIASLKHPVIFYCNGVRCKRSENAINIARACGYQKLYWFRGGFDEWLANEYPYAKE